MLTVRNGVSLAAAAAVIAISATAPTVAIAKSGATIHCYGVNSCKGTSDCKSGKHDCKGMNDCKGQGFKELSAKSCKSAHGSTSEPA